MDASTRALRHRRRTVAALAVALLATGCSGAGTGPVGSTAPLSSLPAVSPTQSPTTPPSLASTTPPPVPTSSTSTTAAPTAPTASSSTTAAPVVVSTPGSYRAESLLIRLRFRSHVADVSTTQLESIAIAILNDSRAWPRSGFSFVSDDSSDLTVVLAEGPVVDELCLPLETFGTVNCQNGPVVALNADRWRSAFEEWDGTLEDYRRYVVNHEVGHLIGLRHPTERCPTAEGISALMEPQTRNLEGCKGNSLPLDWEIEWATRRPAMIGPDPDWDGPQPAWPREG